jgi:hypothetical protein
MEGAAVIENGEGNSGWISRTGKSEWDLQNLNLTSAACSSTNKMYFIYLEARSREHKICLQITSYRLFKLNKMFICQIFTGGASSGEANQIPRSV